MIDLGEYVSFQFKQPYWVLKGKDYKKKIIKRNGIDHYYSFRVDEDTPATLVADGCADIMFCVCEDGSRDAIISGMDQVGTEVIYPKGTRFFGVRLLPGYYFSLGDAALKELDLNGAPLIEIIRDESAIENILGSEDFFEQIRLFETAFFDPRITKRTYALDNELFAQTMSGILLSNGSVSLSGISKLTLYSESRIRSVFSENMGISFKSFESIARYQNLLEHLNYKRETQTGKLSEIALKTGYYDQAHMIKDFKKYTLESPKRYIRLLEEEDFLGRLTIV